MVSPISILCSFTSTLQPIFPWSGLLSWRGHRCSTLWTISQRRSPRLPGEPNPAGWWWREAIEPSILTLNDGMPGELIATRSKLQAPAIASMCPIPRKLQAQLKVQRVRSRSSSNSEGVATPVGTKYEQDDVSRKCGETKVTLLDIQTLSADVL